MPQITENNVQSQLICLGNIMMVSITQTQTEAKDTPTQQPTAKARSMQHARVEEDKARALN